MTGPFAGERPPQRSKLQLWTTACGELSRVTRPGEIDEMLDELMAQDWVVYAKRYLNHTDSVIDYLARYTHRIAITNARNLSVNENGVSLRYRDYADHNRAKTLHLEGEAFIHRYLLHVLSKGFARVRHYGVLVSCCRVQRLAQIREALALAQAPTSEACANDESDACDYRCPLCKIGHLIPIDEVEPRLTGPREKRRRSAIAVEADSPATGGPYQGPGVPLRARLAINVKRR
jgi:hypothetical protein